MEEKILLVLLPFWTPLIPPMGIACLKSFLARHGYHVTIVDANVDKNLRKTYDLYFDALREHIPADKRGNFYSVGQDVLRNHMMAHFNYNDEENYTRLVEDLIYKSFYAPVSRPLVDSLNRIITDFYTNLEEYVLGLLEKEKPSILGVSAYNGTLPASVFACKLAKEKDPGLRTLMGGGVFADQLAVGTPNLDYFLEKAHHFIDKIFIGESELLFLKYLRDELPGNQKVYTLNDIDWRVMDLAAAKPPDFSDLDIRVYPYLAAYTSRSCPFQCKFCSETVQWGNYRKKSAQQIVRELRDLFETHGKRMFFMSDSLLNPVLDDLAEEFIKSDFTAYWDGCIRAERHVCDIKNTSLWRRGGFYRARLGIESGSQRLLDLMNKKITVQQSKEALMSLAYAGIKTSTLWVIGFPGETDDDFQETLNFLEENRDYIYNTEGTPFWYHLGGQSNSDNWMKQDKNILLYPAWAKEMLLTETWIIRDEPSREKLYERVNRFTALCEKLEIPNTYSLHDIYIADERWKRLHQNAVPTLLELSDNQNFVEDCKSLKEIRYMKDSGEFSGDFEI